MIPDLTEAERFRLAAAYRDRRRAPAGRPEPTVEAPSSDPCSRCGIPGWRGCDHYLPLPPRSVNSIQGKR